jgi:hypothetical protein
MQPLADLHRHLDGSLREATLRELAAARGIALPDDLRFRAGMGLDAALQRFQLTVAVLQDPAALRRVASEACEDAAQSGVTTLELRFAPQLHGDIGHAIDAVLEGIDRRAGVIVCALYGDSPASVEALARAAARRDGVVGIDLAGHPVLRHRLSRRARPRALAGRHDRRAVRPYRGQRPRSRVPPGLTQASGPETRYRRTRLSPCGYLSADNCNASAA